MRLRVLLGAFLLVGAVACTGDDDPDARIALPPLDGPLEMDDAPEAADAPLADDIDAGEAADAGDADSGTISP